MYLYKTKHRIQTVFFTFGDHCITAVSIEEPLFHGKISGNVTVNHENQGASHEQNLLRESVIVQSGQVTHGHVTQGRKIDHC